VDGGRLRRQGLSDAQWDRLAPLLPVDLRAVGGGLITAW
jgi:hypothetical protein